MSASASTENLSLENGFKSYGFERSSSSDNTPMQNNIGLNAKNASPLNLTNALNNLSLGGSTGAAQHSAGYSIRLKNLPSDLTVREANAIFALANGMEITSVDLLYDSAGVSSMVVAKLASMQSAIAYAEVLDSKQFLLGPNFPQKIIVEVFDETVQTLVPFGVSQSGFSGLFASSGNQYGQYTAGSVITPPGSNGMKRPSLSAQRSRFSFNDPFGHDTILEHPAIGSNRLTTTLSQDDSYLFKDLTGDLWKQTASQPQTPSVQWGAGAPAPDRRPGSSFFGQPVLPASSGNSQSPLLNPAFGGSGNPPPVALDISQPPQKFSLPVQPPVAPQPSTATAVTAPQSQPASQTQSQPPSQPPSQQMSQVDLSLLARVPPPANPADQNPPCNTLYVGNLPSDATEQQLRQLFSAQAGFRRLSFRNKNNGSGHGPMCFVEFEDVSFATRALAELYGKHLPRAAGQHNKGGIRLSFSKNPLGVRGPSRRNNQQQSDYSYSYKQ